MPMPGKKAISDLERSRERTNGDGGRIAHGMQMLELSGRKICLSAASPITIPPTDQATKREGTAMGLHTRLQEMLNTPELARKGERSIF